MMSKRAFALCLVALCAPTVGMLHAEQRVPFKGTWTGLTVAADLSNFPLVGVVADGGGQFTHLGNSTMISPHTTNVFTGETIGDQIFTAANGDTLTAHCEGFPLPQPDGTVVGSLDCSFTSGTGRFEGVAGSYVFFLTATPRTDGEPGYNTVADVNGTISTVGSNQ